MTRILSITATYIENTDIIHIDHSLHYPALSRDLFILYINPH